MRRGFTLIELLIAAAIALLIFAVGFSILLGATKARSEVQSRLSTTESARLFFQLLERDLTAALPSPSSWTPPLHRKQDLIEDLETSETNAVVRMLTATEVASPTGQEAVCVRYYLWNSGLVKPKAKVLFREVALGQPAPDITGPGFKDHSAMDNGAAALLPGADMLCAYYLRWYEEEKVYLCWRKRAGTWEWQKPDGTFLNDGLGLNAATHLEIGVGFLDPNTRFLDPSNPADQAVIASRRKMFWKRIPIPAGFKD